MSYFEFATPLSRLTLARAEVLNALFQQIENSFADVPDKEFLREGRTTFAVAAATAPNVLALPLPFPPAAYTQGLTVRFLVPTANTGPVTLAITSSGVSLGPRPLVRGNGAALIPNDIASGQIVDATYDGAAFRIVGFIGGDVSAAAASAATAQAAATAAGPIIPHIPALQTLFANLSRILAVSDDLADVDAVAARLAEITILSGLSAQIAALGAIPGNITTVAANIASVNTAAGTVTAAGLADDIEVLSPVAPGIAALGPIAAAISAVAAISAAVSTVATNVADVTNFSSVYYGPRTSDPTTRPSGAARVAGDMYFNTTVGAMRFWSGSAWTAASGSGLLQAANNLSDLGSVAAAIANLGLGNVVRNTRQVVAGTGLTGGGALSADRSIGLSAATQAAIALALSAVQPARTITAGDGLSGGGNLAGNRSFSVDSTVARTVTAINSGDGLVGGGNLGASRTLRVDGTVLRTTGGQSVAGMTFTAAASFSGVGTGPTDFSRHLSLNPSGFGIGVLSGQQVYGATPSAAHVFYLGPTEVGRLAAGGFSGRGTGLTELNASSLTAGSVPAARLTSVPAASLTGTIVTSRLPTDGNAESWVLARLPAVPATRITGTVAAARLPTDANADAWVLARLPEVPAVRLTGTIHPGRLPATSGGRDWVLGRVGEMVEGTIGTPAMLIRTATNTAVTWGQEIAGSALQRAGVYRAGQDADNVAGAGSSPSGTWKALCDAPAVSGRNGGGLFVRVA